MSKGYIKGLWSGIAGTAVCFLAANLINIWIALAAGVFTTAIISLFGISNKSKAKTALGEDARRVSMKGRAGIRQINEYIYRIQDANIKDNLKSIGETCNKIVMEIGKHPEKAYKAESFFEYYIPVTTKIISKYEEIMRLGISTPEAVEFASNVGKSTDDLKKAFSSELSGMMNDGLGEAVTELKILNTVLENDGYINENKSE